MSLDRAIAAAARRFQMFRGRAPRGQKEIVSIESDKVVALEIGPLVGVLYKKNDGKKPFLHRFNSKDRPVLYASSDGSQLYILAGGYKLTSRGIVG